MERLVAKRKSTSRSDHRTNGHALERIRLIVADENAIDRAGLMALLEREADMDVIGATQTIEDTIEACREHVPDVLLLTLTLPGLGSDEALPAILTAHPQLRVVGLSEHSHKHCLVLNPPMPVDFSSGTNGRFLGQGPQLCSHGTTCLRIAAQHGARGTVRRNAESSTLLEAIRLVHAGQTCHAEETHDDHFTHEDRRQPLSDRERTVAAHISRGLSNKEIASALDISEATVKKHVGRVLAKLGLQDRLQVGLFLVRNPMVLRTPAANEDRVRED